MLVKITLLLVFCISMGSVETVQAQFAEEGYIVTNTRDTLWGKIKVGTPAQRSVKVTFVGDDGVPVKYAPFQIKSYYLKKMDVTYESKIYDMSAALNYGYGVFMERLCDGKGPVRAYEYWNTDGERGYIQTFLQYTDDPLVEVNYPKFKTQMAVYFDDFPQLSAKIERGAFKKKHLLKIVEEYNTWRMRGW